VPTLRPGAKAKTGKGRKSARRPAPPRWLKPALRGGVIMLALGSLAGGAWWFDRAGYTDATVAWLDDTTTEIGAGFGLSVREILVQGRNESDRDAVLRAVGIGRGEPILAFDPQAAKERLETLPWVRKATVERRLPDTIFVRIEERRPLAVWQKGGQFALVDRDGEIIQRSRPERYGNLPLIIGEGAPEHAPALLAILASEPELRGRITAMARVADRRWTLTFDNGMELHLPEQDVGRAWAKFASTEHSQGLLNRDIAIVDLRLPDRLVVRLSPDAERPKQAAPRKTRGKET
jgi:cell division protein FtsQ